MSRRNLSGVRLYKLRASGRFPSCLGERYYFCRRLWAKRFVGRARLGTFHRYLEIISKLNYFFTIFQRPPWNSQKKLVISLDHHPDGGFNEFRTSHDGFSRSRYAVGTNSRFEYMVSWFLANKRDLVQLFRKVDFTGNESEARKSVGIFSES